MRPTLSSPWFTRRAVGYGWRPVSWQGWAVTSGVIVFAVTSIAVFKRSPAGIGLVLGGVAFYLLIASLTAGAPSTDSAARGAARAEHSTFTPAPLRPAPAISESEKATDPANAALLVERLTKRFGERIAVSDVSFSVARGEVFGFLGPNGAGKTTTVRTLGTLIAPTSGSAIVAGLPLSAANGGAIRQRISIMPESPGLYLRLSVYDNLEFFAGLFCLRYPAARIAAVLEAVNLTDRADDLCASLSKGLRQRVGLARALLNEPEILFLDEPTSGLDPVATREVHELIDGLRRRGVTVFLTTHRLEEAERLCDRVAILNTTLRAIGRPEELRTRLFKRSLVVRTAAPLAVPEHVFEPIGGVSRWSRDDAGRYIIDVEDPEKVAPALTRALVSAGADVLSIAESRHSLEDVYLEMVDEDVEARPR